MCLADLLQILDIFTKMCYFHLIPAEKYESHIITKTSFPLCIYNTDTSVSKN